MGSEWNFYDNKSPSPVKRNNRNLNTNFGFENEIYNKFKCKIPHEESNMTECNDTNSTFIVLTNFIKSSDNADQIFLQNIKERIDGTDEPPLVETDADGITTIILKKSYVMDIADISEALEDEMQKLKDSGAITAYRINIDRHGIIDSNIIDGGL